jgi:hypothetical protein
VSLPQGLVVTADAPSPEVPSWACLRCRDVESGRRGSCDAHPADAPSPDVETVANLLIDLRIPNPLRSGPEHDIEMSGVYSWPELLRFAAALRGAGLPEPSGGEPYEAPLAAIREGHVKPGLPSRPAPSGQEATP